MKLSLFMVSMYSVRVFRMLLDNVMASLMLKSEA